MFIRDTSSSESDLVYLEYFILCVYIYIYIYMYISLYILYIGLFSLSISASHMCSIFPILNAN